MKLNLELLPRTPGLLAGHDNRVEVMIRLSAPEGLSTEDSKRSPLNLAVVIDRSGSMDGEPLYEAKRCASYIVDRLTASDHLSLITYDSRVNVVMPARRVTDKPRLKEIISEIYSGGSTNLHGGWLSGAEQVAVNGDSESVSRVLLLSDGNVNSGITDHDEICGQCEQLAQTGVTTSTYGLGLHFNELLMVRMGTAGGGNSYYGQTAEDLLDPFIEEFDLLRSMFAKAVHFTCEVETGLDLELVNEFPSDVSGWRFPDIATSGDVWAILRINVPSEKSGSGNGELIQLMNSIVVTYEDADGKTQVVEHEVFKLPSLPPTAWQQLQSDTVVDNRVIELEVARIQRQAIEAARRRDWDRVDALLFQARGMAKDNAWVVQSLVSLERYARRRHQESFSKEAMYKSQKMMSRKVSRYESHSDMSMDLDMPSYLQRKSEQGKKRP